MRTRSNGGAVVTCDGFDLLRTSVPIPLLPYFGNDQSRRAPHPRIGVKLGLVSDFDDADERDPSVSSRLYYG